MLDVERFARKFLRETLGIKPDYITTMMFINRHVMHRNRKRRKSRHRNTIPAHRPTP
jgi:hypothetical protein